MTNHADTPVDYDESFKKHDLQGPLLWELYRTEEEKHFVETRKRVGLLKYHTNMQLLNSSDQAGPVEDFLCGCLTKMSEIVLEGAAPAMIAAMHHIKKVNSRAFDAGTEIIFFYTKNYELIPGRIRA